MALTKEGCDYWARANAWHSQTAAFLAMGRDPRKMDEHKNLSDREVARIEKVLREVRHVEDVLVSAYWDIWSPKRWIEAFAKAQVAIPEGLRESVNARTSKAKNVPLQPTAEKALDPRERATLLRIIRALGCMAKLPERGAATSVEKQLEELGFASPKDTAIRAVLKNAASLQPD